MTLLETRPLLRLDVVLDEIRRAIGVTKPELDEARRRRRLLIDALLLEFAGGSGYVNGSVAHGDALNPLNDVDLGVIVPNPDGVFGPGRLGPAELKRRAAARLRRLRGPEFPGLTVEEKEHDGSMRKRSILVRFGDPVTPGQPDFTADVIIAIDNPNGAGLYIPRFDQWDRSDPKQHTALIRAANEDTHAHFARTVRLVKHWNRRNGAPLCSWNIKALALAVITAPGTPFALLTAWFDYAITALTQGETEDPAHVAHRPIKLNRPGTEVVQHLRDARSLILEAAREDALGRPEAARDALARLFNDRDVIPRVPTADLTRERLTGRGPALVADRTATKTSPRSWAP